MEQKEKLHRLFFALWPDDEIRAAIKNRIQQQIKKHPAKKVPVYNWHITLAFLGNVTANIKQCVQEKADQVQVDSCELRLDKLGHFKRTGVVWLGSETCPEPLTKLVEQLNSQLADCDYQSNFKTFIPHMTLLRKAYKALAAEPFEPVTWKIDNFVLVESVTDAQGPHYEVINRWTLN
jgi:2'-5' RNA ligase